MKKEKLDILYEDKSLIIVNKKSGILTIANDKEKEKTLYHEVHEYLWRKNKNNKVFIIHRLDKDTSGIVIFAKNDKIKKIMQDNWENVQRYYYALCHGNFKCKSGTIINYLKETKTFMVYDTKNEKNGDKYDWIAIFLTHILKLRIDHKSKWTCSELVSKVLQLLQHQDFIDVRPASMAPKDVANILIK